MSPKTLRKNEDAYGHLIYDFFKERRGREVVEREDGLLDPSDALPAYYFAKFQNWHVHERRAMRFVRGRVLDIGCGAGRVALYLQRKGFAVLGVDISPLAVKVCRLRRLKARLISITQIDSYLGTFDTFIMFGNNFGLFGNARRTRWLLRKFHGMSSKNAKIIAESTNPYQTTNPIHLAYHRFNRRRGRMPGQVRIRVRYRTWKTPWFNYLLVSKKEMRRLVHGTGWSIERFIDSKGPQYIAVLGRSTRSRSATSPSNSVGFSPVTRQVTT